MPLSPGTTLEKRYRIVSLLGQGGFGAVYRVWDINMESPRALKENLDTSEDAQRQFKREAKILDQLKHPNLPRVIDHFIIPNQGQYLVMDYVEGEDLQVMLQRLSSPLAETQVLAWVNQICDALDYLHNQSPPIIHRDIKPANIRITPEGRAMLVDFGIAKIYDPQLSTTAGARAITPGYSPPEQYGSGMTDARTDIYALGATLYHLLTGIKPTESVQRTMGVAMVPPRQANPLISRPVEEAIKKAMQPLPNDRFYSILAFKQVLAAAQIDPSLQAVSSPSAAQTASSTGAPQGSGKPMRVSSLKPRRRSLVWLLFVTLATIILLTVILVSSLSGGDIGNVGQSATPSVVAIAETATDLPVTEPSPTAVQPSATTAPTGLPAETPIPQSPTATATDSATPTALPSQIVDSFGVTMALVPAGEFQMGDEEGNTDESPVHTVRLDDFYIDIYEVTNARYDECVRAGACETVLNIDSETREDYYGSSSYADYPVIYVTWNMAQTYCRWRGVDLPTEAQWEKAARGGLPGADYPWGDREPVCLKRSKNGAKFDDNDACDGTNTEPVGSYHANGYGLYDMAGNVWEWTQDWYNENYYHRSPDKNPTGPASGIYRVVRGGSWYYNPFFMRVAARDKYAPALANLNIGFRCASSTESQSGVNPLGESGETSTPGAFTRTELPAQIEDDFGASMALVSAGEFSMGADAGEALAKCQESSATCQREDYTAAEPRHLIYLDDFYIDIYEVTNGLFADFLNAKGVQQGGGRSWYNNDGPGVHIFYREGSWVADGAYRDHPVVQVTWFGADAFCGWRGAHLPTEAQWEKAARGGLPSKNYPWGDDPPVCNSSALNGAVFSSCNDPQIRSVGAFMPNSLGLHHIAGNVTEWVQDWFAPDYYSNTPNQNPAGPQEGSSRVVRGGSWNTPASWLLLARRYGVSPTIAGEATGFRCARSP